MNAGEKRLTAVLQRWAAASGVRLVWAPECLQLRNPEDRPMNVVSFPPGFWSHFDALPEDEHEEAINRIAGYIQAEYAPDWNAALANDILVPVLFVKPA